MYGESFIINFDEKNKISDKDYKIICEIVGYEKIKIKRIVITQEFQEENELYIFFSGGTKTNYSKSSENIYDGKEIAERVYKCDPLYTTTEDYNNIWDIGLKYYKWWEENDKFFDSDTYATH